MKFIEFYNKYIEPFTAIFIVILLCILISRISAYNNLQEEIAQNCGWEEEDTRCYCEKGAVVAWENSVGNGDIDLNLSWGNDNG